MKEKISTTMSTTVKKESSSFDYECDVCGENFESSGDVFAHVMTVHVTRKAKQTNKTVESDAAAGRNSNHKSCDEGEQEILPDRIEQEIPLDKEGQAIYPDHSNEKDTNANHDKIFVKAEKRPNDDAPDANDLPAKIFKGESASNPDIRSGVDFSVAAFLPSKVELIPEAEDYDGPAGEDERILEDVDSDLILPPIDGPLPLPQEILDALSDQDQLMGDIGFDSCLNAASSDECSGVVDIEDETDEEDDAEDENREESEPQYKENREASMLESGQLSQADESPDTRSGAHVDKEGNSGDLNASEDDSDKPETDCEEAQNTKPRSNDPSGADEDPCPEYTDEDSPLPDSTHKEEENPKATQRDHEDDLPDSTQDNSEDETEEDDYAHRDGKNQDDSNNNCSPNSTQGEMGNIGTGIADNVLLTVDRVECSRTFKTEEMDERMTQSDEDQMSDKIAESDEDQMSDKTMAEFSESEAESESTIKKEAENEEQEEIELITISPDIPDHDESIVDQDEAEKPKKIKPVTIKLNHMVGLEALATTNEGQKSINLEDLK